MEEFKHYTSRSILTDQFFLVYQDSQYVFQSSGLKSYRYVYAQKLGLSEEAFSSIIDASDPLPQIRELSDEQYLFLYPVRVSGFSRIKGTLGFIVEENAIRDRISLVTGGIPDHYVLTVDGVPIIGTPSDQHIHTKSEKRFSISGKAAPVMEQHYSDLALRNAYLFIILTFLLGLSAFLAYRAYLPLRKLSRKYALPEGINEIESVDGLLHSLLNQNENVSRNIKEQFLHLKPQMLKMLLLGNCEESLIEALSILGIGLNKFSYSLFMLKPCADTDTTAKMIEDMSDEQLGLYPVSLDADNCLYVLACMDECDMPEDVLGLLESLIDSAEHATRVYYAGTQTQLNKISVLYRQISEYRTCGDSESIFDRIVACMRKGEWDQASILYSQIPANADQALSQPFVMHTVIDLIRIGREQGFPIDEVLLGDMMLSCSFRQFVDLVMSLNAKWMTIEASQTEMRNSEVANEVIEYIHAHYMEYTLSLDSMANAFHVSTNTLYRLIKRETNMSYREYVIRLRIDIAKRLLLKQDKTVTDIAALVGYVNLSHFIKSFKAIVGVTPTQYRSNTGTNE